MGIIPETNITRNELADALAISDDTVKRNLASLKDKKYIERVGANKNGYWQLLKK